jgi:hypothetical protein
MALIATENQKFSNVVKQEYNPDMAYCRATVVVNGPAATLAVGTVVGKVTATGKYKVSIETAVDGSEVAAGIVVVEKAVAASTDTNVVIMNRGPASVNKAGLVLDATYDDATKKGVVYASLEAVGIQVLNAV